MSGSVNKAILIGHLGGDPDIRVGQSGAKVGSFSMATSESWRDKDSGERKERTQWHRVVIFNEGLIKVAEQYLKKGAKVYVEGQIETRKWTDQAGVEKYVTEIVLRSFNATLQMLDRREGVPAATDPDSYGTTRTGGAPSGQKPAIDDEIPF